MVPVAQSHEQDDKSRLAVAPGLFHASRVHAERPIAATRVLLATASLFAIWLDPAEPERYVEATYTLLIVYVVYSLAVLPFAWRRPARHFGLTTHLVDIGIGSLLQVVTMGPSSPFFACFVFSVCCGALRWDWRGTLATAIIVFGSYLLIGVWMALALQPEAFELNRFIIRAVYLAVVSALLLFLGRHEIRLRAEIERLARWPAVADLNPAAVAQRVLAHAATIVGARRALAVWDSDEEPWIGVVGWNASTTSVIRLAPEDLEPVVADGLVDVAFWCADPHAQRTVVRVIDGRAVSEQWGAPIHNVLLPHIGPFGVVSAPFHTARLTGRVFFSDVGTPAAEMIPLTEVVAREIGTTIDHAYASRQQRVIAASEERIRLARDLHDGVLQSLTGVRLELQDMAESATSDAPDKTHDRLISLERALAIEQRELRFFIEDLRPATIAAARRSLDDALSRVRERIAMEWKVPVSIRVAPATDVPHGLEQPIALMVHETVVNALKHAEPSRVSVDVHTDGGALRIAVADDGRGFAFQGRRDLRSLTGLTTCPESLRERVESLGGDLTIESGRTGSRVEISVPLMAAGRI
jgi:signal transduction histidine kinase